MYHCHLQIYLLGQPCSMFETVKGMEPLQHFTHTILESGEFQEDLAKKADLILADLRGEGAGGWVQLLAAQKKEGAELIFLIGQEQRGGLEDFSGVKDIWICPMPEEELRFRLSRWQQSCQMQKEFWQASQYLETTLNSVPNLIWYKDKDGIHEKVNDSFCRTVNKTRQQVEGQRHAYIWDVEHDDPACIESEKEVMTMRKSCVSEETIMTGGGTRLLTTYKSPLYDLDGSVMGTVGIGIDITQERAYEQELMKKNRMLEMVFTSMDCGVMTHSLDGSRILSVNQAALKILGYESQEELFADGFDMVACSVVEEDRFKLREYICSLKKEGDSVSMEYCVRHKNGDIIHVMGNVKLLK